MPKTPSEGVECRREFRTIGLGCALQRLFSTFPDGWPGFGLLLLRLSIGIVLIYFGATSLLVQTPAPITVAQNVIATAAGVFLLTGLWTPIMGALAALDQIWIVVLLQSSGRDGKWIYIFLAVLSASVAMLGPGAWSIDARVFGRRRFPSGRTRGSKPSP
jgi:putative oxidoreductase